MAIYIRNTITNNENKEICNIDYNILHLNAKTNFSTLPFQLFSKSIIIFNYSCIFLPHFPSKPKNRLILWAATEKLVQIEVRDMVSENHFYICNLYYDRKLLVDGYNTSF